MTAKAGEGHHMAQLTDAQVRVIRALRERNGWTCQRIAEVFDTPWRTVVNLCGYANRRGAGSPTPEDFTEAERIRSTYEHAVEDARTMLESRITGLNR